MYAFLHATRRARAARCAPSLSFCHILGATLHHCCHIPQSAKGKRAHPSHICTRTGLTPATSAPGLGPPRPHLRRDWARPLHESTERHGRKERVRFLQPHHAGPVPVQMWAAASKVPAQMWARRAQSRRRCGRGEPSYVASGRTSVTKRSTQHTPSAARTTASANGRGRPARTVASESPPGHTLGSRKFPVRWPISSDTFPRITDAPSRCADVAGAGPVPAQMRQGCAPVRVQMWQGRTQSRCRCRRGAPSPGADAAGANPVPVQMRQVSRRTGEHPADAVADRQERHVHVRVTLRPPHGDSLSSRAPRVPTPAVSIPEPYLPMGGGESVPAQMWATDRRTSAAPRETASWLRLLMSVSPVPQLRKQTNKRTNERANKQTRRRMLLCVPGNAGCAWGSRQGARAGEGMGGGMGGCPAKRARNCSQKSAPQSAYRRNTRRPVRGATRKQRGNNAETTRTIQRATYNARRAPYSAAMGDGCRAEPGGQGIALACGSVRSISVSPPPPPPPPPLT